MNKKQKVISLLAVIVFTIMILYPPWKYEVRFSDENNARHFVVDGGYAFIFKPPIVRNKLSTNDRCTINYFRLLEQQVIVAVITWAFIIIFKDEKKIDTAVN